MEKDELAVNNQDAVNGVDLVTKAGETKFEFPPMAGLFRRLAAFFIDGLLLGILGQIIGWSASSFWFTVGPYGRILGLVIILLYFGLLYSKVSNGQTLGKRLLKIAVRDKQNRAISIPRSLLRSTILTLPFILNGWVLPVSSTSIWAWFAGVIVFGVGATIVYTMIFNRGSKQGIHDLICGTYVVRLEGEPIEAFPQAGKIHWIVSGVLVSLVIVIITVGLVVGLPFFSKQERIANLSEVQRILMNGDQFHTVNVGYHTTCVTSSRVPEPYTVRSIEVNAWYKGRLVNEEKPAIMNEIAETVLLTVDDIDQYDSLEITLRSAFDLGISSGKNSYIKNGSIEEWKVE